MHLLKFFDKLSLKPDNAKELKGLILDLAIRGRLTEEWRHKNPQNNSLQNEISNAPFELPPSWSWKLLDSISDINGLSLIHI